MHLESLWCDIQLYKMLEDDIVATSGTCYVISLQVEQMKINCHTFYILLTSHLGPDNSTG